MKTQENKKYLSIAAILLFTVAYWALFGNFAKVGPYLNFYYFFNTNLAATVAIYSITIITYFVLVSMFAVNLFDLKNKKIGYVLDMISTTLSIFTSILFFTFSVNVNLETNSSLLPYMIGAIIAIVSVLMAANTYFDIKELRAEKK